MMKAMVMGLHELHELHECGMDLEGGTRGLGDE